jgi:two-component system capsular synthesis response regulator RcsB
MRKLGLERDSELFQYAQSNGLMNLSSYAPGEASNPGKAAEAGTPGEAGAADEP